MATLSKVATAPPKQLIRRFLKALSHGQPGDLAKYAATNIVGHQGSEKVKGIAALEAYAAYYRAAFRDWDYKVDLLIAEGAWVAAHGRTIGVMKSGGARFCIPWLAHYRIVKGKIAEAHMLADTSALSTADPGVKLSLRH